GGLELLRLPAEDGSAIRGRYLRHLLPIGAPRHPAQTGARAKPARPEGDTASGVAAQASSAALACAAILPNASGSLTARSASTLRSSGISALRRPATSWLYESPSRRAAALMRMIHSRLNVRFRFFLSR